jgi:hypothetical protein
MRKWILPEAIEDVLPAEAARVEALRRTLLDHFRVRGYRLVQPPLVEFLDSLLTGTGRDLDLITFMTVDPLSGRMLGLRADTTPQVARIDAHLLNEPGVTRLCYAGSVLRTTAAPGDTRQVVQIGAELYGHEGIDADRETMQLLLSSLEAAGIRGLHLDLGHVGLYRALARAAGLEGSGEGNDADLFAALRDKDIPAVHDITARLPAVPEPSAVPTSTVIVDRAGELLRPYTIADGRWRRSTDPRTRHWQRRVPSCPRCAKSTMRSKRWPRSRQAPATLRQSTSTSRTCAATTTTRVRRSRRSPRAQAAR